MASTVSGLWGLVYLAMLTPALKSLQLSYPNGILSLCMISTDPVGYACVQEDLIQGSWVHNIPPELCSRHLLSLLRPLWSPVQPGPGQTAEAFLRRPSAPSARMSSPAGFPSASALSSPPARSSPQPHPLSCRAFLSRWALTLEGRFLVK